VQGNRLIAALGLCWPRQALPVLKQQVTFRSVVRTTATSAPSRRLPQPCAGHSRRWPSPDVPTLWWQYLVGKAFTVLSSRQRLPSVLAPPSRLSRQQQQPR
jgi:hypothetical protein